MLKKFFTKIARPFLLSQFNTRGCFYAESHIIPAGATLAERWNDIAEIIELRKSDHVLDIGCAEGLISMEIAKRVAFVYAIDHDENRIVKAKRLLKEWPLGKPNIYYECKSLLDFECAPLSYDVVLLLSVINKKSPVTVEHVKKLLVATRRQIIIRTNIFEKLREIALLLPEYGFYGEIFENGPAPLLVGKRVAVSEDRLTRKTKQLDSPLSASDSRFRSRLIGSL